MKKNILLILILSVLLLFAGCNNSSSNTKQNGFGDLSSAFNGGDQGVSFKFEKTQLPELVYDNGETPFGITINVENVGEYDVPDGDLNVVLTGFNPADFGISLENTTQSLPMLIGVRKQFGDTMPGGNLPVLFSGLKYIPSGVDHNQKIYANVCYPYRTTSYFNACINGETNTYTNKDNNICDLVTTNEFVNSGAPIKVKNIKQSPFGSGKIQFQFEIVHSDTSVNGMVYKLDSLDNYCMDNGASLSSAKALIDQDYIKYTVESGIDGLNCGSTNTNTGLVKLGNTGSTIVTCIQDTTGQPEYEKPIKITLDYDYFDRELVEIPIKHLG